MRFFLTVLVINALMTSPSWGQDAAPANPDLTNNREPAEETDPLAPLKKATVEIEVDGSSFFTDMTIKAVVRFPELVSEPLEMPGPDSGISVINLDVMETDRDESVSFINV